MNIIMLSEGRLVASNEDGVTRGGADLVGATMVGTLASGVDVALQIDDVLPSADADRLLYAISFAPIGSFVFSPLCGVESGSPVLAVPLSGGWDESEGTPNGGARIDDPSRVTFACEGYALAKCVDLGYAPWRRVTECLSPGVCRVMSLSPFHQACTRMLRADYCGDGTSFTRDGTVVDVWDAQGIQDDVAPSWSFEAEWTRDGAACVSSTRWPTTEEGTSVVSYIEQHCPSRWQAPGCGGSGSTFFSGNGFMLSPKLRVLLRSRVDGGP